MASDNVVKGSAANGPKSAILPGQTVVHCCEGKDTKKALPRRMIPKISNVMKAEVKACCKKPQPGPLSATRRP